MSRRIVVGRRNNGDFGLFVSPPGVDAFTAADSALKLSINSKVSQLILMGSVASTQSVILGLSQQPIVLVTGYNDFSSVLGSYSAGPMRPSPATSSYSSSSATISSGGASMTISCAAKTVYAVYSKAF